MELLPVTVQFGEPLTHGISIVPTVTLLNTQEAAGAEALQFAADCCVASA